MKEAKTDINDEFVKLLILAHDSKASWDKISEVTGIHKRSIYNIVNSKGHYQKIPVDAPESLVECLKTEQNLSEEFILEKLGITDINETFSPPDTEAIAGQAQNYMTFHGLSLSKFIKELKSDRPALVKVSDTTFNKLVLKKNPLYGTWVTREVKKFLEGKDAGKIVLPKKLDREKVIKEANQYRTGKKISPTDFARSIVAYDSSIGVEETVLRYLKGTKNPPQKKLRIIKSYLEKAETLSKIKPFGNITGLYHALNPKGNLKEAPPSIDSKPEEYQRRLTAQVEQAVIEYHQKNGKQELPPLILKHLFGSKKRLCRLITDFRDRFPLLADYLAGAYRQSLLTIFDKALSAMPQADVIEIAGRYTHHVRDREDVVIPRIGVLAKELKDRYNSLQELYEERGSRDKVELDPAEIDNQTDKDELKLDAVIWKLERGIKIRRADLEVEIMKKLDSAYWPSHKNRRF